MIYIMISALVVMLLCIVTSVICNAYETRLDDGWYRWFAWRPVYASDVPLPPECQFGVAYPFGHGGGKWVWLKWVEYRWDTYYGDYSGAGSTAYRLCKENGDENRKDD